MVCYTAMVTSANLGKEITVIYIGCNKDNHLLEVCVIDIHNSV